MTPSLHDIYQALWERFGPQNWWPGESPFEVIVGAVLVQNTAWKNVERAIDQLRAAEVLSPQAMAQLHDEELAELIRPAGYYRLKTRRLRNLLNYLVDHHEGDLDRLFAQNRETLRAELLAINGVGPETADSILLYAAELPVFVVDTYTHRMLARHGWIDYDADYHQMQEFFENQLEADVSLFNEFHALIVRVGHLYCRKQPKCEECPLCDLLPEGGIVEPW